MSNVQLGASCACTNGDRAATDCRSVAQCREGFNPSFPVGAAAVIWQDRTPLRYQLKRAYHVCRKPMPAAVAGLYARENGGAGALARSGQKKDCFSAPCPL